MISHIVYIGECQKSYADETATVDTPFKKQSEENIAHQVHIPNL